MATSQNVRVGLFVSFLFLLLGGTLFMVSGSTKIFEEHYVINASWNDVAGLKQGSVVRLSGIDVGEVTKLQFSETEHGKIHVTLSISETYQHRIRQCTLAEEFPVDEGVRSKKSSIARIDSIGVLGDKYVSISVGDPDCLAMQQDDWIQTVEALDIVSYTKKVTGILNNTDDISSKVNNILGSNADIEAASLAQSLGDLKEITREIKEGNGLIHTLIYDENLTKRINSIMRKMDDAATNIDDAIRTIKTGDGLAHELVYGHNGENLARQLQAVSVAMTSLIEDIKTEEGLVNALIYDDSKIEILNDLAETASLLKETSDALQHGDGTAALLMRDPALYEDLRSLVGGAQRNKLLRSYIRMTVEQNEVEEATPFNVDTPTRNTP